MSNLDFFIWITSFYSSLIWKGHIRPDGKMASEIRHLLLINLNGIKNIIVI